MNRDRCCGRFRFRFRFIWTSNAGGGAKQSQWNPYSTHIISPDDDQHSNQFLTKVYDSWELRVQTNYTEYMHTRANSHESN